MPKPTNRNDYLVYGSGNDTVGALSGNDIVLAGSGDDSVDGNAGADLLFGGAGRDHLRGGAGLDIIDGGSGTDAAYYSGNQSQYRIATADGITTVRDLRGVPSDGFDFVTRIERLVFADGVVLLKPNRAPDAEADAGATDEDTAVTLDVVANDTDPDGDVLTLASLSDADAGTAGYQTAQGATISIVDGEVRYDPTTSTVLQALGTGASLEDSFSYSVDDGFGGTDTATVAVTVAGLDDALVLPDFFQGLLEAGDQGEGEVTNGPSGVNEPGPAYSDYWAVRFSPGETLEISVRRADAAYDPVFWLFEGIRQPSDFDGGFESGFLDGGDAGFITAAEGGLPPAVDGGRFEDAVYTFTSTAGGLYTVVVTNGLSGGVSDDGLYEYDIFVKSVT